MNQEGNVMIKKRVFIALLATSLATCVNARSLMTEIAGEVSQRAHAVTARATAPDTAVDEVAFSPNEGALELVVKVIDSSRTSIRMLAYSFTSAPVVAALVRAKGRGVDVAIVIDYRHNVIEDRSGKAAAAIGTIVNAGIPLRTSRTWDIHHDKVVVVDQQTIQTGSFNYSAAAAKSNSENVLVLWNRPALSRSYLAHWKRNWDLADQYRPRY
jgi:phosphatidylserine/phosphatidylglycerophosphate/cardiolipin synthase-like enzyme